MRIIRRMKYVVRMRRLVRIIKSETDDPTHFEAQAGDRPSMPHCLKEFEKLSKAYTPSIASETLTMAINEKYIVSIPTENKEGSKKIAVTGKGLILLTPTGFVNTLGASIGTISPIASVGISVGALIVSIISLVVVIKLGAK
jgi:hypothetical protein